MSAQSLLSYCALGRLAVSLPCVLLNIHDVPDFLGYVACTPGRSISAFHWMHARYEPISHFQEFGHKRVIVTIFSSLAYFLDGLYFTPSALRCPLPCGILVLIAMTPSQCMKPFGAAFCSLMKNPVDSTGLRQRKTEQWNGITPTSALIGGRYNEQVSRPQARWEQDCRKS